MTGRLEWRLLPFRKTDAFENMAIDEALLAGADAGTTPPTLRLYGWDPPAVSLGYFQDFAKEVNEAGCQALGLDIVRRPTGGKAVLHDREITYSVVASRGNPLFPDSVIETYKVISSCLAAALASLGISAVAEPEYKRRGQDGLEAFCFSEPSRFELLVAGKKICGSAQVRTKKAFLQHGSLLLDFDSGKTSLIFPPPPAAGDVPGSLAAAVTSVREHSGEPLGEEKVARAVMDGFQEVLGVRLCEGELSPAELREKTRLREEKYAAAGWNIRGGRFA